MPSDARWVFEKIQHHTQVGHGKMLSGVQKGQKCADVIYGWSLREWFSRKN